MSIKDLLVAEHSKRQTMKIVNLIGNDQKRFDELISFSFGNDYVLAQRSSWPVCNIVEKHPELAKKHLKKLIDLLEKPVHNAVRRHILKLLYFVDIPESQEAKLISICFNSLNTKEEFLAVKVFSMILLDRFCVKYPDIWEELKAAIETQLPYETPGFKSRGKKILRKFSR
jgi:hypothetical protein